jgi:type I restriction enzyme S subunit
VSEFPLVKLSEVVRLNPRNPDVVPAETDQVSFVPMAAVEAETGRFNASETRVWGSVKKGYTRFQENDVLIAKITPCMENGKACVARHLEGLVGAGSTEFHVLRPITSKVEPEWILRFVNQRCIRHEAKRHMSGAVGQQRVPASFYQDLQLPLPDLETQQEILERLEDHDFKIDATERALFAIQAKLKQARASILKAAVEGRLVETEAEISSRTGDHYEDAAQLLNRALAEKKRQFQEAQAKSQRHKKWKEPCKPDLHGDFSIPEGWAIASMDQIAQVSGGLAKDSKITCGESLPYLRVANVQRGRLELENVKTMICPADKVDDLLLRKGDVLLNEGGDRDKLGRGWIWNGEINRCIHQNHVFKARIYLPEIQPRYISYYCNTMGDSYFQDQGKQTTNLASISLSKVRALPLTLPPATEQLRILKEVDRRFSVLDQIDTAVNFNLRRCGQLRQAVLKRAFRE